MSPKLSSLQQQLLRHKDKHELDPATCGGRNAAGAAFTFQRLGESDLNAASNRYVEELVRHTPAVFEELTRMDPEFQQFREMFLNVNSNRQSQLLRMAMSESERKSLDDDLERFCFLLSPHLENSRVAEGALEILIQSYKMHIHNAGTLLACMLPYHDQPRFARLLQYIAGPSSTSNATKGRGSDLVGSGNTRFHSQDSRWAFLAGLEKERVIFKRSMLVTMCLRNTSVFGLVCDTVKKSIDINGVYGVSSQSISLLIAVFLEVMSKAKNSQISELSQMAGPVMFCLLRHSDNTDLYCAALTSISELHVRGMQNPGDTDSEILVSNWAKAAIRNVGSNSSGNLDQLMAFLAFYFSTISTVSNTNSGKSNESAIEMLQKEFPRLFLHHQENAQKALESEVLLNADSDGSSLVSAFVAGVLGSNDSQIRSTYCSVLQASIKRNFGNNLNSESDLSGNQWYLRSVFRGIIENVMIYMTKNLTEAESDSDKQAKVNKVSSLSQIKKHLQRLQKLIRTIYQLSPVMIGQEMATTLGEVKNSFDGNEKDKKSTSVESDVTVSISILEKLTEFFRLSVSDSDSDTDSDNEEDTKEAKDTKEKDSSKSSQSQSGQSLLSWQSLSHPSIDIRVASVTKSLKKISKYADLSDSSEKSGNTKNQMNAEVRLLVSLLLQRLSVEEIQSSSESNQVVNKILEDKSFWEVAQLSDSSSEDKSTSSDRSANLLSTLITVLGRFLAVGKSSNSKKLSKIMKENKGSIQSALDRVSSIIESNSESMSSESELLQIQSWLLPHLDIMKKSDIAIPKKLNFEETAVVVEKQTQEHAKHILSHVIGSSNSVNGLKSGLNFPVIAPQNDYIRKFKEFILKKKDKSESSFDEVIDDIVLVWNSCSSELKAILATNVEFNQLLKEPTNVTTSSSSQSKLLTIMLSDAKAFRQPLKNAVSTWEKRSLMKILYEIGTGDSKSDSTSNNSTVIANALHLLAAQLRTLTQKTISEELDSDMSIEQILVSAGLGALFSSNDTDNTNSIKLGGISVLKSLKSVITDSESDKSNFTKPLLTIILNNIETISRDPQYLKEVLSMNNYPLTPKQTLSFVQHIQVFCEKCEPSLASEISLLGLVDSEKVIESINDDSVEKVDSNLLNIVIRIILLAEEDSSRTQKMSEKAKKTHRKLKNKFCERLLKEISKKSKSDTTTLTTADLSLIANATSFFSNVSRDNLGTDKEVQNQSKSDSESAFFIQMLEWISTMEDSINDNQLAASAEEIRSTLDLVKSLLMSSSTIIRDLKSFENTIEMLVIKSDGKKSGSALPDLTLEKMRQLAANRTTKLTGDDSKLVLSLLKSVSSQLKKHNKTSDSNTDALLPLLSFACQLSELILDTNTTISQDVKKEVTELSLFTQTTFVTGASYNQNLNKVGTNTKTSGRGPKLKKVLKLEVFNLALRMCGIVNKMTVDSDSSDSNAIAPVLNLFSTTSPTLLDYHTLSTGLSILRNYFFHEKNESKSASQSDESLIQSLLQSFLQSLRRAAGNSTSSSPPLTPFEILEYILSKENLFSQKPHLAIVPFCGAFLDEVTDTNNSTDNSISSLSESSIEISRAVTKALISSVVRNGTTGNQSNNGAEIAISSLGKICENIAKENYQIYIKDGGEQGSPFYQVFEDFKVGTKAGSMKGSNNSHALHTLYLQIVAQFLVKTPISLSGTDATNSTVKDLLHALLRCEMSLTVTANNVDTATVAATETAEVPTTTKKKGKLSSKLTPLTGTVNTTTTVTKGHANNRLHKRRTALLARSQDVRKCLLLSLFRRHGVCALESIAGCLEMEENRTVSVAHILKASMNAISESEFYLVENESLNNSVGKGKNQNLKRAREQDPITDEFGNTIADVNEFEARNCLPAIKKIIDVIVKNLSVNNSDNLGSDKDNTNSTSYKSQQHNILYQTLSQILKITGVSDDQKYASCPGALKELSTIYGQNVIPCLEKSFFLIEKDLDTNSNTASKSDTGSTSLYNFDPIFECLRIISSGLNANTTLIPRLNSLTVPLLGVLEKLPSKFSSNNTFSGSSLFTSLRAYVGAVGKFLSPYLLRFLELYVDHNSSDNIKQESSDSSDPSDSGNLSETLKSLLAALPFRVCLPVFQKLLGKVEMKQLLLQKNSSSDSTETGVTQTVSQESLLARYLHLLTWSFKSADFNNTTNPDSIKQLQQMNETVHRDLLKKLWRKISSAIGSSSTSSSSKCSNIGEKFANCYAQFALRLDISDVQLRFMELRDWSKEIQESESKNSNSNQLFINTGCFFQTYNALVEVGKTIVSVPILPLILPDIVGALESARESAVNAVSGISTKSKKRGRRQEVPELQFHHIHIITQALNALSQSLNVCTISNTTLSSNMSESLMTTLEPIVHIYDLAGFRVSGGPGSSSESLSSDVITKSAQSAFLQLVTHLDTDALRKNALLAMLHKTQQQNSNGSSSTSSSTSNQPAIRLAAVLTLTEVWKKRGHELVGCGIGDLMLFAVELLEDSNESVAAATRNLLAVVEEVTGEDVGEMLKS